MFEFDNTYAKQLEGFYKISNAARSPIPKLIGFNQSLATDLGAVVKNDDQLENIFSGNSQIPGSSNLAQVYAGHQFGHFSQQLGDGRALQIGEVVSSDGRRFDIQLKGSGRTPYSRGGDGKSALGPVLREYIMCEAMHTLGIPTTRALAAVSTGENVMRTELLPGAVFTRVAASHIRVGTFEYFSAQGEQEKVKKLADYTIKRHYPHLCESQNPYLEFLQSVSEAQALLVAKWMLVGFIHGVMNTDNMTVSGETIDYGPCAFMDEYSPNTFFSSIDTHGRYAYQNQPMIAQWNLARLAESLLFLFDSDKQVAVDSATNVLNDFPSYYDQAWVSGMHKKLGLVSHEDDDIQLMNDLLASIDQQNVDYTQFFRKLSRCLEGDKQDVFELFEDPSDFMQWLPRWRERLERDELTHAQSIQLMHETNPVYIPRNHKVEEVIESAVKHNDFSLFEKLNNVLSDPFVEKEELHEYEVQAPKEFGSYKTFCGT